MSVHKTKKKIYEVRWRFKGRQRSKAFKRKVDADKFEASLRLDNVPDFLLEKDERNKNEPTFREMTTIWLRDHAEVHNSPSTIIRDHQIIRDYLLPSIGHLKLSQIVKRDFVEIQSSLRRRGDLKPKTINNITGLCHKIFADIVDWGYLTSNPSARIKPIKCPEVDYKFWTFDERDRFLIFVKSRNERLYQVIAFAAHTGMRRGEVEGLLRDCVDYDRREIIVKRSY